MYPTSKQLDNFHWQCDVMRATGASVVTTARRDIFGYKFVAIVFINKKEYHFADPDLLVITKQLATLVNHFVMS